MAWRTDLLNPIAGPNPAGEDLRYDAIYDKIKEARREEDDAPQGAWARPRKVADWPQVVKLAGDALAAKSKDLQLAVWLTEAMLRREGISGLRGGLELLIGLIQNFWDHLYPELEDGDAELRAAPLAWLGLLEAPVKFVALNRAGHNWFQYKDSRAVGYEADCGGDYYKLEARKKAIEGGRLAPEDFDKSFEETPKAWYKQLAREIDGSLKSLEALDTLCNEKFGDASPSFTTLRQALEEVQQVVRPLLQKKLELEPDPPEEAAVEESAAVEAVAAAPAAPAAARTLSAEPVDRDDAVARLVAAARFLRQQDPRNPAPYLVLRGLRWGELRGKGPAPDARALEAPPPQIRAQIKTLALDSQWGDLLEAAETAMAMPWGRGWLDLQRYALKACRHLGPEYRPVENAIRSSLGALLADLPQLPEMTMMDDTPTANEETRNWLQAEFSQDHGSNAPAEGAATAEDHDDPARSGPFEQALAAARAGRHEQAVEILMRELARERSPRGRFRRKTQLARVLVEADQHAVAKPILDELLAQIEQHRLEEWEAGEVVAEPLALLYRCLGRLEGDSPDRQALYLRICRLDPVRAIQCVQAADG